MKSRVLWWVSRLLREEEGQTAVEYVLGISVIAVGMSLAFIYMSDSTKDIFNNARRMVELPYP
jgi:Flp pilus assembly pilin Flp